MGGSILSTVDGVEVTVEHVAAIEQKEMLQADYGNALENSGASVEVEEGIGRRPRSASRCSPRRHRVRA